MSTTPSDLQREPVASQLPNSDSLVPTEPGPPGAAAAFAAPLADSAPRSLTAGGVGRVMRLVALYVAQGIPYGFQTYYIPLQLAQRPHFTYREASYFTLASLPWMFKMLWAPAADAHYWPKLGRRRSWILPAQFLLSITALTAMNLDFSGALMPMFIVTMLFNLWASVQDIAVDGLAVEMLTVEERGLGNAAQVGGYKIGMIAGGSGLIVVAEHYGVRGAMIVLALGVAALLLVPLFYREPPPPQPVAQVEGSGTDALKALFQLLTSQKGWLVTLLFIATVKIGETMVSGVIKPFLVREAGFSIDRASFTIGVLGLGVSLLGSVIGGYVSGWTGRLKALVLFGVVQAIALSALGISVRLGVRGDALMWLVVVEHFAAGLLTPALFAYMMDITEPAIAATHYTFLSTVELLMKGTGAAIAGPLADHFGVPMLSLLAGTLGALPLLLLPRLRRPLLKVSAGD